MGGVFGGGAGVLNLEKNEHNVRERRKKVKRKTGSNGIFPTWASHFGPKLADAEGKSRCGPNYGNCGLKNQRGEQNKGTL